MNEPSFNDRFFGNLWRNYEKFTDLTYVMRGGFIVSKMYRKPTEEELHFRPESVAEHSARVANLLSEIMLYCPEAFSSYDKLAVMKVILDHDIGEIITGDIPDDGSPAHDAKAQTELDAIREFYAGIPESAESLLLTYHQQFEDANTFLGQMLRMVDKVDAIGRLILYEKMGIYGNIYDKEPPSAMDVKFAEEIGTGNCTDVWARHLQWLMYEKIHFYSSIAELGERFLREGLHSIGRSWFNFWITRY